MEEVEQFKKEYFARKTKDGKYQLLKEHLQNTANFAKSFDVLGLKNIVYLMGILHDIGKATYNFQNYLINDGERGTVFHSPIGSKIAFEILKDNNLCPFFIEMISMCIAAHHSQLYDGLSLSGEKEFLNFIENNKEDQTSIRDFLNEYLTQDLIDKVNEEINQILSELKKTNEAPFVLNMVIRYVYSCLIDADRLDAKNFEIPERVKKYSLNNFINSLEKYLKNNFLSNSIINSYRKEVSNACLLSAKKNIGIYKLEVPTGGGKTLASLRFALNHMKLNNLKRVIYVVPYLSIIEQTAQTFYKVLAISKDSGLILEHHSNYIPDINGIETSNYKYLESRWESPIIITTAVQFLESIFSNKASDQRKFHNMCESVIIFDEIQSLPPKCFYLFNSAMNFLSTYCKSTIILCSATQVPLNKVDKPVKIEGELILPVKLNLPRRTKIIPDINKFLTYEELSQKVINEMEKLNSVLIITNTKKDALKTYEKLKQINNNDFYLYYLSTLLCPKHRLNVIDNLKENLKSNKKIICVSTQLIEAGVDISFDCVIRALTGLDSIIQAAGRCNRSGEFEGERNVYVVKIKDENLSKLPEIKSNAEITSALINCERYNKDLLSCDSISKYYEQFLIKNKNKFEFISQDGISIYNLLSTNSVGKGAYKNKFGASAQVPALRIGFRTAGKEFFLIDKRGISVVVPFDEEAENLINQLHCKGKLIDIFKRINQYSVNLFDYQIKDLKKMNAIFEINGIFILNKKFYDSTLGLNLGINSILIT